MNGLKLLRIFVLLGSEDRAGKNWCANKARLYHCGISQNPRDVSLGWMFQTLLVTEAEMSVREDGGRHE